MKPGTAAALALLRAHPEGITSLDALLAGCGSRLAARVAELKADGYDVRSEPVTVPTTAGHARVSRYSLATPTAPTPMAGIQSEAFG